MHYKGAFDDLKLLIEELCLEGHWINEGVLHVFSAATGARLNWWPATGLLMVQGKPVSAQQLQRQLEAKLAVEKTETPADLKLVIDSWAELPEAIRTSIIALVHATKPDSP
jgi:hypothetical protein